MQTMNMSVTHVRGTSWLHRLSPLAKLTWLIAVMCFAFAGVSNWSVRPTSTCRGSSRRASSPLKAREGSRSGSGV